MHAVGSRNYYDDRYRLLTEHCFVTDVYLPYLMQQVLDYLQFPLLAWEKLWILNCLFQFVFI